MPCCCFHQADLRSRRLVLPVVVVLCVGIKEHCYAPIGFDSLSPCCAITNGHCVRRMNKTQHAAHMTIAIDGPQIEPYGLVWILTKCPEYRSLWDQDWVELKAQPAELFARALELWTRTTGLRAWTIELFAATAELKAQHAELFTRSPELWTRTTELRAWTIELFAAMAELKAQYAELFARSPELRAGTD